MFFSLNHAIRLLAPDFGAMSNQKHATEFEKIINDGRERKRNEELAARIFTKDNQRRASAPIKNVPSGSLASRVGVKKVCKFASSLK